MSLCDNNLINDDQKIICLAICDIPRRKGPNGAYANFTGRAMWEMV